MNYFNLIKIFTREFFKRIAIFLRYLKVLMNFCGVDITWPVNILFDDISALKIGNDVTIGAFSEIVVLKKTEKSEVKGELIIGNRAVIGSHANIRAAGGIIQIGENALIAQNVSFIAANHSDDFDGRSPYRDMQWDEEKTGIIIGENVWIGAGVILLPGSSIGNNSIIAGGSVVTRNIPENEIWSGVPAKYLRKVSNIN